MARNNVRLINYHTTGTTAPQITDMVVGEIAVGKDLIWSKHNANEELSVFISSGAVHSAITAAETTLKGITDNLSNRITENTNKFNKYATSADTVSADEKVLSSAKTYTDLLKAKEGETYNGETLAGLKSEINSLKGDSTTTVEALATRVTTAEGKITTLETTVGNSTSGLVKDVADLKTTVGDSTTGLVKDVADLNTKIDAVSGASSAYTDSQINAIKGDSYKTGTTLASLESNLGTEKLRIDAILKDAPNNLKSFKDVDTKITNAITAAYKYQGSVDNYSDLPENVTTIGFVYNVKNAVGNIGDKNYTPAGTNYAWNGTEWDALGGTIDLSTYATKTYVNDALTGVTGTGPDSIVTRLDTAESDITKLKNSASTLNTEVQTIKGWKINDKFISGSPILNGTDIKVDDTPGAQTLRDAIASAKTAGDSAMIYAQGVSGSVKALNDTVVSNKNAIDKYTINGLKISEKPVLTGENVKVSTATTAQTLNEAIAEAKAAGTAASSAVETLRGGYKGTINSINDSVTANTSDISQLRTDVNGVSAKTITAVQTITVTNTRTNGIKAEKTGTNVTFNFDNMVIDCGEF